MAYTFAGQFGPEAIVTLSGAPQPLAEVTVYEADGSTLATLYTDRSKGDTAGNPVVTDALGNLQFYAEPSRYVLSVVVGTTTRTFNVHVDPDPADIESNTDAAAAVAAHAALPDPHPGYLTPAEGTVAIDAAVAAQAATDSATYVAVAGAVSGITRDGSNRITGLTENGVVYSNIVRDGAGLISSYDVDGVTHTVTRDGSNRVTGVS